MTIGSYGRTTFRGTLDTLDLPVYYTTGTLYLSTLSHFDTSEQSVARTGVST